MKTADQLCHEATASTLATFSLKLCLSCGLVLPMIHNFYRHSRPRVDGSYLIFASCKACFNAQTVARRQQGQAKTEYLSYQVSYHRRDNAAAADLIRSNLRRAVNAWRDGNSDYVNTATKAAGVANAGELVQGMVANSEGIGLGDALLGYVGTEKIENDHMVGLANVDLKDASARAKACHVSQLRFLTKRQNNSEGGKLNRGKRYQPRRDKGLPRKKVSKKAS